MGAGVLSPMSHPEVVEALIQAGLAGMESVDTPFTQQELLSAAFSMTIRIIDAIAVEHPEIIPAARQGAEILLLRCAVGRAN